MMNMIGLFSGIGGFELAAQRAFGDALEIKCMVEIEPFCQKVLTKNFPGVPIHGDIKTFKGDEWGPIDLVTGGFPCQPFSTASRGRKTAEDLSPEMVRVVDAVSPKYVVGENVCREAIESVAKRLRCFGYGTIITDLSACSVGADHKRNRWWLVAYPYDQGQFQGRFNAKMAELCSIQNNTWGHENFSRVLGVFDGVRRGLDRRRLEALGNAVVLDVAERIFGGVRCVDEALSAQA